MKKAITCLLVFGGLFAVNLPANAQLLKKLKDKVTQAVDKNATQNNTNTTNNTNNTTNTNPTNTKGAGLTNTAPPDVIQSITDAETANQSAKYSEARYSIQQALMGVEIQIGRELLQSLPATVDNMPKDTTKDKVMSTSYGWNNLSMQRVYSDGKDKLVTVTIGNQVWYSSLVNLYFNNVYIQQNTEGDQNVKQTRVKGNRAIIQFDQNKGYTLIVPIGQASMITWECVNFADENEVMNAANTFDIDGIKKMLGEQ